MIGEIDAEDRHTRSHIEEGRGVFWIRGGYRITCVAPGDDASKVGAVAERVDLAEVYGLRLEREVGTVDGLARHCQALDRHHS